MRRKKRIYIFILFFTLLGFLLIIFSFVSECKSKNTRLDITKIPPYHLTYQTDSFDVQRQWIKISRTEIATNLSIFTYYPVISETIQEVENLPNSLWQADHIETIRKKIGDTLAVKMAKAKVKLAMNGKIPNKKLPLIIFGPGLGWLPTDYSYLLKSLASRGYIIVAITGIPISKQVYFPDNSNEKTETVKADYIKMGKFFTLALTEILKSLDNKENIFSFIDSTKVIVMGHSISGAAGLLAASNTNQIKYIINLDGDVNDDFKEIQPAQPVLYITTQPQGAENSNTTSWNDDKSEKRRDNAFLNNSRNSSKSIHIKIPEMYHLDFLDVAYYKSCLPDKYKRKSFGKILFSKSSEIVIEAITLFIEGKTEWSNLEKKYGIYIAVR